MSYEIPYASIGIFVIGEGKIVAEVFKAKKATEVVLTKCSI